jgi:hypothetical protein
MKTQDIVTTKLFAAVALLVIAIVAGIAGIVTQGVGRAYAAEAATYQLKDCDADGNVCTLVAPDGTERSIERVDVRNTLSDEALRNSKRVTVLAEPSCDWFSCQWGQLKYRDARGNSHLSYWQ